MRHHFPEVLHVTRLQKITHISIQNLWYTLWCFRSFVSKFLFESNCDNFCGSRFLGSLLSGPWNWRLKFEWPQIKPFTTLCYPRRKQLLPLGFTIAYIPISFTLWARLSSKYGAAKLYIFFCTQEFSFGTILGPHLMTNYCKQSNMIRINED